MDKMAAGVVVAGAGVMGTSIAQLFARHGYPVSVYDISETALEKSRELMALNQTASVEAGDMTEQEAAAIRDRIYFFHTKDCFVHADFVVEAIAEKMEIKHAFWKEVSDIVPQAAVLTTNTSGLSVTEIAKAVRLPERFCGMHWLNPPHICPLIEIIRGEKTEEQTLERVRQTGILLGRVPVILKKEVPGFLINRFQFAVLREAMSLVEEGVAQKEDIDKVFKFGLGLRYACLGPFEIADLGGLDTFYQIAKYLFADISDTKEVHRMLAELVEEGSFGVKSKRGFYDYGGTKAAEVIQKRDRDFLKVSECLYGGLETEGEE